MKRLMLTITVLAIGLLPSRADAQAAVQQPVTPPPPPATKLEGFKPAAGSVVTLGYDELGNVGGISVDVRELVGSSAGAVPARGLLVEVTESQYRRERSFVDGDEIPELIKAIDALLEVQANPTKFTNFEVRYTTKGELRVTAFNSSRGGVSYAVDAGRTIKATKYIDASQLKRLRELFVAAEQKLVSLSP